MGGLIFAHTPERSIHLIGARQDAIRNSISVLDRGGPPLLTSSGGQPFPAEAGDDPGMILYLSLLGHTFGTSDSIVLLKWFFVAAFGLLLAVYPILWFEVFSSVAAAVLSPLLVLLQFRFLAINDVYWISAWCLLLCLPLLVLVYQRWGRGSLAALVGAMLVASFSSSIRSQAGLPIFLAAAIVTVLRVRQWLPRLAFVAVLAVAYIAISGLALHQIRHHRDLSAGKNLTQRYSTSHGLWHPAFLGLGFLPNNLGITWNDQVAFEAAKRKNPSAEYLSPDYERTVRSLYFTAVREHPGFALRVYLSKTAVVVWDAFRQFWLAFFILPAMLMVPTRVRAEMRLFGLLLVPAIFLGGIPPILAMPFPQYEFAWLGAWGFAWLLGTLWLAMLIPWVRMAQAAARNVSGGWRSVRFRLRLPPAVAQGALAIRAIRSAVSFSLRDRAVRVSATILLAVCGLFIGLGRVVHSVQAASFYQLSQTGLAPAPVSHGPVLAKWTFGKRQQPPEWTVAKGTQVSKDRNGWAVQTTRQRWSYQLLSPRLALHPGAYAVLLEGEVRAGGLDVGVVDVARNAFIVQNLHSARQRDSTTNFHNGRMFARFELASNSRIQVVLANWTRTDASSRWRLGLVSLVRQTPPCGCSPPDSNAWISH